MSNAAPISSDDDPVQGPLKDSRRGYIVQRRYKRAQWLAAVVVGLLTIVAVGSTFEALKIQQLVPSTNLKLGAFLVLVAGFVVPWLLVGMLWRWKLRRNDWDWQ